MPKTIAPVARKVALDEQGTDFAYWQGQPAGQRLATLAEIRGQYNAWQGDKKPARSNVLPDDSRDFLYLLARHEVRYLIIGGFAVAYHGHPRYTKDLDLWLAVDKDNAAKMIAVLDEFGFSSLGLTESDFLDQGSIIQLGHPPNRLDLLVGLKGMDFDQAFSAREEDEIDGVPVAFINLEHLRQSKRLAGRSQDLADLENLE